MKKLKANVGIKSIILIIFTALLVAADLLTKFLEEHQQWSFKVIPGFIEVSAGSRNPGCAFSFLDSHPEIGQPVLITLTFILLAALIFAFIVLPERFTFMKTVISLVAGGAIGNLVDRLMFRSVRDFVGINMFGNGFVYCNFADFFIVIGTVLAVLDLLFLDEWAIIPLTKRAKAAQALRKEEKGEQKEETAEDNKGGENGD